ncbi:hypothetical protein [Trinickia mobilis]|uniref:hypothetical protein n=1 Tax=Trinickia mobilis TaxID=2816356 RepID=UPI001A908C40|nr:hypothetical protein [Trinickia mobilis]
MKTKLLAALLVAVSASIAAPAFASGYGPAPFYKPQDGAPAAQRGQSVQTLAVEQRDNAANVAFGGVRDSSSQSGAHAQVDGPGSIYFGRH